MAAPTPLAESVALAQFKTVKASEAIEVSVHFNPASLQYTVSNTLKDEGSGAKKKQYVSQTTAKLTMDLVFDTTVDGRGRARDDRQDGQAAQGPRAQRQAGAAARRVRLGRLPLHRHGRAVQGDARLTSARAACRCAPASTSRCRSQDVVFDSAKNPSATVDGDLTPEPVTVPTSNGPTGGPSGVANSLGDPRAARAIASANGAASLRFSAGAELAVGVGAGVSLGAAAAFSAGASAGFGVGVSGGIGLGISGGAGVGVSAGAGFGVSGGASAGFGAGAGASAGAGAGFGVSVGSGASASADFSGLRAGVSSSVSMPSSSAALSLTRGCGKRRRRAVRPRRPCAVERIRESLCRCRRQCRADGAARIRRAVTCRSCSRKSRGDRPRARPGPGRGRRRVPAGATRTSVKRCDARFT